MTNRASENFGSDNVHAPRSSGGEDRQLFWIDEGLEVESLVAWFLVPARVSLGSAPGLRDRMTGKSQNGA